MRLAWLERKWSYGFLLERASVFFFTEYYVFHSVDHFEVYSNKNVLRSAVVNSSVDIRKTHDIRITGFRWNVVQKMHLKLDINSRIHALINRDAIFSKFSFAQYANDVRFQEKRPAGTHEEGSTGLVESKDCTALKQRFLSFCAAHVYTYLCIGVVVSLIYSFWKESTVALGRLAKSCSWCWSR